MNNLFKGAGYLMTGFHLMNQQGIRSFAYWPMAINTLLFSFAIWLGYSQFDSWLNSLMPSWLPDFILSAITWIILPLFTALVSIIVFFSFSIVANVLAAPFNGPLSEAVEKKLTGQTATALPWKTIVKETPAAIWNELKKIKYFLLLIIPLFIVSLIPGINLISPLLWIVFSAWMLTLEYHDYPMGNHHLAFPEQRDTLKQQRNLTLGFGLAVLGITMIPLVNFVVIPAAVAGATALYIEQFKTKTEQ